MEAVEARVHQLTGGEQVPQRLPGQHAQHGEDGEDQQVPPQRRGGAVGQLAAQRPLLPPPARPGTTDRPAQERVADRGERDEDRQPVQPGIVPGDDQVQLGEDHQHRGERGDRLRQQDQPDHPELDHMAAEHLEAMPPARCQVRDTAQGPRHRLSLVMVVHRGQVPPGVVAAHLDHPGTELKAQQHPAQEEQDQQRGRDLVGAEEAHEEPALQQHRLPAEAVEHLPHGMDREVQAPHRAEHRDHAPRRALLRQPHHHRGPQHDAGEAHHSQQAVAVRRAVPPEQRRPRAVPGSREELLRRQQATLTQQHGELAQAREEGQNEHRGHTALDDLAGDQVIVSLQQGQQRGQVHLSHLPGTGHEHRGTPASCSAAPPASPVAPSARSAPCPHQPGRTSVEIPTNGGQP